MCDLLRLSQFPSFVPLLLLLHLLVPRLSSGRQYRSCFPYARSCRWRGEDLLLLYALCLFIFYSIVFISFDGIIRDLLPHLVRLARLASTTLALAADHECLCCVRTNPWHTFPSSSTSSSSPCLERRSR